MHILVDFISTPTHPPTHIQFKRSIFSAKICLSIFLVSQEIVGKLDVKTKTVHFNMQRKTPFITIGVIPFELSPLNEGQAMNLATGIFSVPVPGIYHFEFSGVKYATENQAGVKLQINGENVAIARAAPIRNFGEVFLLQPLFN